MKILSETVFVAVFGSIRLHSWTERDALPEDAYSLFVSRSASMGWLSATSSDQTTPSAHARWGMNDAGQDWSEKPGTSRIAWVQVAVTGVSGDSLSLPIQPLVSCVRDVVARVGKLRLDGLQLLLPLHAGGVPRRELVSGRNWFAISEGDQRVRIAVTLDGGESRVIQQRAESIAETVRDLAAGVFHLESHSTDQATAMELLPQVVDELWLGSGHHQVTFFGTLPERSFDALGWTASLFAEACHLNHVDTTALVSIGRPSPSDAFQSPSE